MTEHSHFQLKISPGGSNWDEIIDTLRDYGWSRSSNGEEVIHWITDLTVNDEADE